MDGPRFDLLTKQLIASGSRRGLLKGLAAAAVASVLGRTEFGADAAACRAPGRTCAEHANCCSGLCGPKDATLRRRCRCASPADCPAPGRCGEAVCADGVCHEAITP